MSRTSVMAAPALPAGMREATEKLGRILRNWASGAEESPLTFPATSPNGFDITLFSDPLGVRASFGGLEQDFDAPDQAAAWVACALSDAYRLKIECLGNRPWRWTLEPVATGESAPQTLASGHLALFAFLRKKRVIYRQNNGFLQIANWPLALIGAVAMTGLVLASGTSHAKAGTLRSQAGQHPDAAADHSWTAVRPGLKPCPRPEDGVHGGQLGIDADRPTE